MKILLYEVREDEKADIARIAKELKVEVVETGEVPSLENAGMAEGCDGVSILGQGTIDVPLLDVWKKLGVECLSTRTIGFNHIDVAYAKSIGIHVCNASYEPDGVSDFTIMMMLMCLRNYKQALWRGQVNDFALKGLMGRELKHMTVGVIGTGKIGAAMARICRGFGMKVIAYDVYQNESLKDFVTYVTLDELLAQSDLISLHCPLMDSTYHMINRESIKKMKDGVILVNTSRGGLVKTDDLIEGIRARKFFGVGLDVYEEETPNVFEDRSDEILEHSTTARLLSFPNVMITSHQGFFTEEALRAIAETTLQNALDFEAGKETPNIVRA